MTLNDLLILEMELPKQEKPKEKQNKDRYRTVIQRNHSILNLQFLCPNCHAQTTKYKGRDSRPGGAGG